MSDKAISQHVVGVFVRHNDSSGFSFSAYLRDYNPGWRGCNVVGVEARNGKEAKKLAIEKIKKRLREGKGVNFYSA
jgi:hypothetical protein